MHPGPGKVHTLNDRKLSAVDQPLEIQRARINTLFVLDEDGDLLTTNEPFLPSRREAPAFYLAWTNNGYVHAFRHNVPVEIRSRVQDLVARRWPFLTSEPPPDVESYLRALGGSDKWSSGPVFLVPDQGLAGRDAVQVTRETAGILQPDFTGWEEEIEVAQPIFASVVDGRAVSVCGTVRRSDCGVEAGVETVEGYRRKGHARRAVAAWGEAARQHGFGAFYSTWWANEASIALAHSLSLNQIGASFHVS